MTTAPIWATPLTSVTEPVMAPDRVRETAAEAGRAAATHTNPRTTLDSEMCVLVVIVCRLAYHGAMRPSAPIANRRAGCHPAPHPLGYGELGAGRQRLVPVSVGDLQLERVLSGLKIRQGQQLFDGHLG